MKKHISTIFAFAVLAASAMALQATELDVKVPFPFKAGTTVLPAGTYKISKSNSGFVLFRGEKGGVFVPISAIGMNAEDYTGKTTFRFSVAGDKYVLKAVQAEQ